MSLNSVNIMGRIVNELELKTTPSGKQCCSFRIAVDANYKKDGDKQGTYFFNVETWDKTAELVAKWFGKGRMIAVTGSLKNDVFTNKEGKQSTITKILANNISFTGEKKSDIAQSENPTEKKVTNDQKNSVENQNEPTEDDDYPF